MAISGDMYRQIGRTLAGAVTIVAARERGSNAVVGLTVSSFVTLSFDPPLVMFAIQHDANSYPAIVSCRSFGVSVLGAARPTSPPASPSRGRTRPPACQWNPEACSTCR